MPQPIVIARAFRGEPLLRVVIGSRGTIVYVANPQNVDKSELDQAEGVGFPLEDVFVFDRSIFSALEKEWSRHRTTPDSLWRKLIRYKATN
jgi:hypothetical protein